VVTVIEAEAQKNASADANLKALASIINISGKQRMLSQRMCLYFMASKNYPEHQAEFKGVLKKVFEQFSGAIQTLSASTLNNTAIKSELSAVVNIWSNYKANKAQILEVREDVEKMYALTNDLTKRFDKITTLYELSGTENQ
jgi:nitrate/nitrite-specific signal transduction histidine kinase